MKRFLLSILLLLAMEGTAFCYVNNGTVRVPTMNPDLIQIDDPLFVNNGAFTVDMSLIQDPLSSSALYTTSSTLNYTNNGILIGVPGFDFENFPASVGQAQWAASFVNNGTGFGGGEIAITNSSLFLGLGINGLGVGVGVIGPFGFTTLGLPRLKVRATNVVDSGLITMNNTGLIDIAGGDLDLRRGRFVMGSGAGFTTPTFSINTLDFGSGLFGNTNLFGWVPSFDLTATTAVTPFFLTFNGFLDEMILTNATVYFQDLAPTTNSAGVIVWRAVYLQDFSPASVTKNVYFTNSIVGAGEFHIEWVGAFRDPGTGLIATNYFYLSDDPAIRRTTNSFFPNPPSDFSFVESTTPLIPATPAVPGFTPNFAPQGIVSNDFSYISVKPTAVLVDTNSVVGGSPTNLPGRIQFSASHSMNLANVRVTGPNYVLLNTPVNLIGNSNAVIAAPYSDLNIGVTNGSLTLSNLLIPELPAWSGVPDAPSAVFEFGFTPTEMGGVQAWSGTYFFVDANGATNDVRILLVNSALRPTSPALQKDVFLHAANNLVISDEMNIFGRFGVDSIKLTIATNANSAFSLAGQLNLLSQDIFWSTSFTNLQYLTNWGRITTKNLANFAGNMFNPNSDPNLATPYQAFVNHGTIIGQGIFIRANYFENTGVIQEDLNNGIDIKVGTAVVTNSSFIAPLGPISIAADSLLLSNGVINAGQALTLTAPCFVSDGYAFGNEFGHITNSTLPNIVTNGNIWSVGGGIRIMEVPTSGDLLGTTITNSSANSLDSINVWPGQDRGCSPSGFANNLALGRMIFNSDAAPSQFTFVSLTGTNALYVDSLEFQGGVTNTDNNGNYPGINIQPGMKIYFAQALMNGVSIAEKLNGKNGGGFCWVSNYAGVYSSTNLNYPDGNTYIYNEALVISPNLDSDGDGTVNVSDATPIPAGLTFDIVNNGPQPCGGGTNGTGGGGTNGTGGSSGSGPGPGTLSFPTQPILPGGVSFVAGQGSYNGLFCETNGVKPASSGSFTANVTSKGGFTAKLQIGGQTYSFSGSFAVSGSFSNSITGKGLAPLSVSLQLVNNDEITGEVSGSGWSAQLLAEQAAFSSKKSAPTDWIGKNTLLLATVETNSSARAGDGFGSVTVSKSGDVQWSGVLPDGAKVTQKSALSKDGIWPLYAAPYGGAGSFMGWMQFTNGDEDIEGSAVWVLPAGKSALYPNGLTNELDATGSSLTGSAGGLVNSTMVVSGTSLTASLTNNVMISGKSGQSSNGTLKLSVNLKTGLFSGSVTDPNSSQKLSFQGALLEKSGIGGGFFLNADNSQGGKVYLAPAH